MTIKLFTLPQGLPLDKFSTTNLSSLSGDDLELLPENSLHDFDMFDGGHDANNCTRCAIWRGDECTRYQPCVFCNETVKCKEPLVCKEDICSVLRGN